MTKANAAFILSVGAALLSAAAAKADFSGQIILGPLVNGDSVTGDTTGANDNNDGWFSGAHIFDIWDGGDDVWQLNWDGGALRVELIYDNTFGTDVDLFLYVPGNLDESTLDSIGNTGLDAVTLAGAAAGTYYILVDSTAGAEGEYNLRVVPAPAGAALLAGGLGVLVRRRR